MISKISSTCFGQTFARNVWSWSWRSIKLLLLHLVGFYITLPKVMMHGQTQIKVSKYIFSQNFIKRLYTLNTNKIFIQMLNCPLRYWIPFKVVSVCTLWLRELSGNYVYLLLLHLLGFYITLPIYSETFKRSPCLS